MKVSSVHNTIGMIVDTYGQLLTQQEQELTQLRAQNAELVKQLARYATASALDAKEVDRDRKDQGGMASAERKGKESFGGRSQPNGCGGAAQGSGEVQGDQQVGEEQGRKGPGGLT